MVLVIHDAAIAAEDGRCNLIFNQLSVPCYESGGAVLNKLTALQRRRRRGRALSAA
jgi:hypothetical protein